MIEREFALMRGLVWPLWLTGIGLKPRFDGFYFNDHGTYSWVWTR